MKHLEYAQAILTAFSEYNEIIERNSGKSISLYLCSDGSGCVQGEKGNILFEFNNLQDLLGQLLARIPFN
jgi:hypothetical protein